MAPREGFEPPTDRLTADCSTAELPRNSIVTFLYMKNCNMQATFIQNIIKLCLACQLLRNCKYFICTAGYICLCY